MTNDEVLMKMDEDIRLRNLSERTRDSYHNSAERFLEFTGKSSYYDLDQDDLRSFLLHLRSEGSALALTTTNQYNSGCKFLLKAVLQKQVDDSQVPNARTHHKPRRPFSVQELILFFSMIHDVGDLAFFLTLYGTGARSFEVRSMKTTDVITDGGMHYIHIAHGKGDKERTVDLPESCYRALRMYWKMKRPENPDGWMFPASNRKDVAGPQYITTRFNNIRAQDTRLCDLSQHSFRHAFATHFLQHSPGDILRLKFLLGHSSLASTEIYVDLAMLCSRGNSMSPSGICTMLLETWCRKHGLPC